MTKEIKKDPLCSCQFPNQETEREARAQFLRDYGDDIPEPLIQSMVSDEHWDGWTTKCACKDPEKIIAAAHLEGNDWYLCTIKGLAVRGDEQKKGYGKLVTIETVEKAVAELTEEGHPRCLVLAADVTFDNEASKKILEKLGFEPVSNFCWAKGEKPADIMHYVRFKPDKDMKCPEP